MPTLPSGTITLLFSDIEGSTALLSRLGPAYADALDVMAWSSQIPDAQEGMRAFLEKRRPEFDET